MLIRSNFCLVFWFLKWYSKNSIINKRLINKNHIIIIIIIISSSSSSSSSIIIIISIIISNITLIVLGVYSVGVIIYYTTIVLKHAILKFIKN